MKISGLAPKISEDEGVMKGLVRLGSQLVFGPRT